MSSIPSAPSNRIAMPAGLLRTIVMTASGQ